MKTSIHHHFVETVRRHPQKLAVLEMGQAWTFAQLRQSVDALTAELLARNLAPNSVVAVLLRKSYQTVVSDLAITAAGCVYMNLDVKSPPARVGQILEVIKPALVLTDEQGASILAKVEGAGVPVLDIGRVPQTPGDAAVANPGESRLSEMIDTDPYCIINTSGSTGVPKGVVLNHRSFFDFVLWSEEALGIDGTEVIGSLSPVIFDIFSYELCMLAFKGSTLCLIDERLSPYPARILEILQKNRVSYIFWVPTIMVNIANMGLLEKFPLPDLRMVWFAGEVFPTVHFNKWFDSLPGVRFVNLYGPIEITLDCTFHEIKQRMHDEVPIPIGRACRNTSLLVLNEDGTPTPDGEVGELHVRGTSLAMGYYNNPEQTARSFIQNPLNRSYPELLYKTGDLVVRQDGVYHFRGRADTMIKHLGYRIELADIEHTILNAIPLVTNVCVVYDSNHKHIIAFCESTTEINFQMFRLTLEKKIPSYMIPHRIELVKSMPMNPNGKIDRLRLKNLVRE